MDTVSRAATVRQATAGMIGEVEASTHYSFRVEVCGKPTLRVRDFGYGTLQILPLIEGRDWCGPCSDYKLLRRKIVTRLDNYMEHLEHRLRWIAKCRALHEESQARFARIGAVFQSGRWLLPGFPHATAEILEGSHFVRITLPIEDAERLLGRGQGGKA